MDEYKENTAKLKTGQAADIHKKASEKESDFSLENEIEPVIKMIKAELTQLETEMKTLMGEN